LSGDEGASLRHGNHQPEVSQHRHRVPGRTPSHTEGAAQLTLGRDRLLWRKLARSDTGGNVVGDLAIRPDRPPTAINHNATLPLCS
jgi:hypothetical protein